MRRSEAHFNSIISVAAVALFVGCTGGGAGGKLSLSGAPTLDDASSLSLSFLKLNEKTISEYTTLNKIDASSRVHFNTPIITVKGSCVFGVAKVAAYVDGVKETVSPSCDDNMNFTWTKTFSSTTPATGTPYLIELKPANQLGEPFNNLSANQIVSVKIVVDTVKPPASTGGTVVGAVLAGGIFQFTGANGSITVQTTGNTAAEVVGAKIANYTGIQVTTNTSAHISFSDTLVEGNQKTYQIVSVDRAGNESDPPESITANYASDLNVPAKYASHMPFSAKSSVPSSVRFRGGFGPYSAVAPVSGGAGGTKFMTGFTGITTQP